MINENTTPDAFVLPEPWDEPVDGATLLKGLTAVYKRYVILPEEGYKAVALWVLHAYAHDAFMHSPLLAFTSPVHACGKTTALKVTNYLVPKPLMASNVSSAVVYRAVEAYRPTLLIDEADTFMDGNNPLRGILNSGHAKESARVIRCDGDSFQPKVFSTWTPKVVAKIGSLPATLESRAIVVPLRRKLATEHVAQLRTKDLEALEVLRRKAVRWTDDVLEQLREAEPSMPQGMDNRFSDNWRPLLAIADAAGGCWPEEARQSATALSAPDQESSPEGLRLLSDIRDVFDAYDVDKMSSDDLCARLSSLEEAPWGEYARGKGITQRTLATKLKPFGVGSTDVWVRGRTLKGYKRDDFFDPFRRYLPSQEQDARESRYQKGSTDASKGKSRASLADCREVNSLRQRRSRGSRGQRYDGGADATC